MVEEEGAGPMGQPQRELTSTGVWLNTSCPFWKNSVAIRTQLVSLSKIWQIRFRAFAATGHFVLGYTRYNLERIYVDVSLCQLHQGLPFRQDCCRRYVFIASHFLGNILKAHRSSKSDR